MIEVVMGRLSTSFATESVKLKPLEQLLIVRSTTECWRNAAQNVTQQLRNQFKGIF